MDYVELASAPIAEDCLQVGKDGTLEFEHAECMAFKHQLERMYPKLVENLNLELRIKSCPHDFGSYKEVFCYYHEDSEDAETTAFELQDMLPENWDEEAKIELGQEYFEIIKKQSTR